MASIRDLTALENWRKKKRNATEANRNPKPMMAIPTVYSTEEVLRLASLCIKKYDCERGSSTITTPKRLREYTTRPVPSSVSLSKYFEMLKWEVLSSGMAFIIRLVASKREAGGGWTREKRLVSRLRNQKSEAARVSLKVIEHGCEGSGEPKTPKDLSRDSGNIKHRQDDGDGLV